MCFAGCCLVSFHFRCGILRGHTVYHRCESSLLRSSKEILTLYVKGYPLFSVGPLLIVTHRIKYIPITWNEFLTSCIAATGTKRQKREIQSPFGRTRTSEGKSGRAEATAEDSLRELIFSLQPSISRDREEEEKEEEGRGKGRRRREKRNFSDIIIRWVGVECSGKGANRRTRMKNKLGNRSGGRSRGKGAWQSRLKKADHMDSTFSSSSSIKRLVGGERQLESQWEHWGVARVKVSWDSHVVPTANTHPPTRALYT